MRVFRANSALFAREPNQENGEEEYLTVQSRHFLRSALGWFGSLMLDKLCERATSMFALTPADVRFRH
jgi:hypothetical protein